MSNPTANDHCPGCGCCALDWDGERGLCRSCGYDRAGAALAPATMTTSPVDPTLQWRALVALGVKMRQAQKAYFRTRDRGDLVNSKGLESEFDKRAAAMLGAAPSDLFRGGR